MIEVKVKDSSDESLNNALKKFKKLCNKDGFLRVIREKRYFRKPSEIKREKRKKAQNLQQKSLKKRKKLY